VTDEIPVLDINAEDREAEALRYADEVRAWQARRNRGAVVSRPPVNVDVELGTPCPKHRGVGVNDGCPDCDHPLERKFEWPCDRRDAHHPHIIKVQVDDKSYQVHDCPGVGAHPLTQIGGGYKEEEI
jgi:hypothetical protein